MDSLTKKELLEIAKENNIKANSSMTKIKIIEAIEFGLYPDKEKRKIIKNDLLDQLERNGVIGEFYIDLVRDYMSLWDVKNKLIEDIEKKGVSVKYQNGENQFGHKKNDSVAELQRTNNQMLRLLDHLGLKPSMQTNEEFNLEDLEM